jgi:hypothetical protein
MVIARLDVLTANSSTVLASELVLPYKSLVRYGPIGGVGQSPLFAPWLSLLREASTATSPFYRLLCAWRVYDGVGFLRKTLKQQADALGLSERLPRDPELDLELLRSSGVSEEFMTGLRRAGDLFAKLTEMRNGVGHFLLDSGEHVYMSDPAAYRDYSLASYVLSTAASDSIAALQGYFATHIEPRTSVGSLAPDRTMADQLIVRDAQSGGPPR